MNTDLDDENWDRDDIGNGNVFDARNYAERTDGNESGFDFENAEVFVDENQIRDMVSITQASAFGRKI